MRNSFVALVLSVAVAFGCTAREHSSFEEGINVIPTPVSMTVTEGSFSLSDAKSFCAPGVEKIAQFFSDRIATSTGKRIGVSSTKGNIVLALDEKCGLPSEGYTLSVRPDGITVTASSAAGIFYGMQTVMQLLPAEVDSPRKVKGVEWTVPCVEISDYPRFAWRGFHVDPCRHFMTLEDTKKQIDLLSEYKVNVMHWHLTDDQGWRLEIKKYPRLTEVSGYRTEFKGEVHGGFYTQDEVREIVAYAAERFVTVVPEIEMPGHSMAVVRAYPEYCCTGINVETFYNWGSPDHVFCIGNEKVFEFLEDVVKEVVDLFPSEYIHVGGDECQKTQWKKCPKCQERIRKEGLAATDKYTAEERLQSYSIERMEKILAKYGKKLIGWDEILEGGLSPNATVMSWRGESGGITAAKMGHDVVMTPSHDGLYLDHYQGDPKIEPVAIGRYTTLEKIYNYNPVPKALSSRDLASHVIGVQANSWSEYLYDEAQREYMMYPRALALAEIAWTPLDRKNFEDFCRRVEPACVRLDYHGINYHIPLPEQPDGSCDNLAFTDSVSVAFQTTRPEKMVYTLDGKEPSASSTEYTAPLSFTESGMIRIRTVLPSGKMSRTRTIYVRKESPVAATSVTGLEAGLDMTMVYGRFETVPEFKAAPKDSETKSLRIATIRELTNREPWTRDMQNVRFYGAEAVGYIYIPSDGVWRFSTDNDQLWIDGRLVVDNDGEVKRYSRHDTEVALCAGYHPVRIVFISNIVGGWTSSRNNGSVLMRKAGDKNFEPAQFFIEPAQ